MAVLPLQQIQVGKEVTRGTVVAPTAKLTKVEEVTTTPMREVAQAEERRASIAPAYNSWLNRKGGTLSMSGLVTYEDLPYHFDSLFGEATPGGVGPYTYDYVGPTVTAPSPRIMTMVYGDGTRAYALAGGICNALTLSLAHGDAMRMTAEYLGHDVESDSVEALSDRALTEATAEHMSLFIDAVGGTVGTTAITTSLFNFELAINANRENKWHIGSSSPGGYRESRFTATLSMLLEVDATTAAYLNDLLTSSPLQKQVRLKATSGTDDIEIDFAGTVLEGFDIYSDEDGVVSINPTFTAEYNTTMADYLDITVTNDVSSLA
jgi:hypothetical protein